MRIVIADHEPSSRSALGMLIQAQPDMEIVGQARDLVELLCLIKGDSPNLVILDWDVFGQRIDALQELLSLFRDPPRIVGLSVRAQNRQVVMDAGATAFACKEEPPERLVAAIREAGKSWLPDPNSVKT